MNAFVTSIWNVHNRIVKLSVLQNSFFFLKNGYGVAVLITIQLKKVGKNEQLKYQTIFLASKAFEYGNNIETQYSCNYKIVQ